MHVTATSHKLPLLSLQYLQYNLQPDGDNAAGCAAACAHGGNLDPRLLPMARWVAEKAKAKFPFIAEELLETGVTWSGTQ